MPFCRKCRLSGACGAYGACRDACCAFCSACGGVCSNLRSRHRRSRGGDNRRMSLRRWCLPAWRKRLRHRGEAEPPRGSGGGPCRSNARPF